MSTSTSEQLYLAASKWIGTREVPGVRSNPTIVEWILRVIPWMRGGEKVDDSTTAWCGVFLAVMCDSLGFKRPAQAYRAVRWLDVGQSVAWDAMVRGDVIVSSRGGGLYHVSLFGGWADNERSTWWSLGGNQKDGVRLSMYGRERIRGVRRPVA